MNRKRQISVALVCCVFLLSCKKDNSNPTGPDTQPLTPGTAIFSYANSRSAGGSAQINADGNYCALDRDSNVVLGFYWSQEGYQAIGSNGAEMKICRPLGLQKYTLGPSSCSYFVYYTEFGKITANWYSTQGSAGSGFINVSFLDRNNKTISGTFEAHTYVPGSGNWDFTNGTFKGTWK
jgi:hypothetical protein